jgi:CspA family cold shock protein
MLRGRKEGTMSERELGTVKWFMDSRGYGFIKRDGGGDVFVHFSAIQMEGHRTLQTGQRVEFTVVQDSKGPKASRVVPLYTAEESKWARLYT